MAANSEQEPMRHAAIGLADLPSLARPWFKTLLQHHLTSVERLRLFRSSKVLAAAVLQCSNSLELKLGNVLHYHDNKQRKQVRGRTLKAILAWGAIDTTSGVGYQHRYSSASGCCSCYPILRTRKLDIRQFSVTVNPIASATPTASTTSTLPSTTLSLPSPFPNDHLIKIHVKLHVSQLEEGAAIWAALPHHQITRLTLLGFSKITLKTLSTLSLQRCINLKHITLGRADLLRQESKDFRQCEKVKSLPAKCVAYLPASLKRLSLESASMESAYPLTQALSHQLTHFSDNRACMNSLPDTLLHLTHYHTETELTDTLLHSLAKLPSLTHVTVDGIQLQQEHCNMQLHWQQLQLTAGASILGLMYLPLHAIQHVVIHGELYCVGGVSSVKQVVEHLLNCPHLQCKPQRLAGSLTQPVFTFNGVFVPEVLSLGINSITSSCTVRLGGFRPSMLKHLFSCLQQLPTNVTQLWLCNQDMPNDDLLIETATPEPWQLLLFALPKHVEHVFIRFECLYAWCEHILALDAAFQAVGVHESTLMAHILLHRAECAPEALRPVVCAPTSRIRLLSMD